MFYALIAALTGCSIKLFSYMQNEDGGIFAIYATGQVIVSASLVIVFTMNLINSKYANQDLYSQVDLIGAIMIGACMATITVKLAFDDSDKFFTKVGSVQYKSFLVMCVQLVFMLVLAIYYMVKYFSK